MLFLKCPHVSILLAVVVTTCLCVVEDENEDEEMSENETKQSTHTTTEETKVSDFQIPDEKWTVKALRDIAYFLRNHKFNEWDRRLYEEKPSDELIGFHKSFPSPSLKTVHWKVHTYCINDFYKCLIYLQSIVETSPFTRSDDIKSFLGESLIETDETSLMKMNNDCKKAALNTEKSGLPFDEPEEKFRWRTSASYYMCWYTMRGIPALSMLGESCDNFANCFDPEFGIKNRDPRSYDRLSFACAMYSFCPDVCCPIKHVTNLSQCVNSNANPCLLENIEGNLLDRQCKFDRRHNQNLEGIIANKWNVSCHCELKGFVWNSQFGMCVDINECLTGEHNCDAQTQYCLNLPGNFKCICKWGFSIDDTKNKCVSNDIIMANFQEKSDVNRLGVIDKLKSVLKYYGF